LGYIFSSLLSEEATDHMCSLKAEIISRLQASFSQPNGDQKIMVSALRIAKT
jgi:hypothetical protein